MSQEEQPTLRHGAILAHVTRKGCKAIYLSLPGVYWKSRIGDQGWRMEDLEWGKI